jgi:hypothetical protein
VRASVRVWHLRVLDLMYGIPRQRRLASATYSCAFTQSYAILRLLAYAERCTLSKLRVLVLYLVLRHWCSEFSQCSGIPRAAEIMTLKTASAT